MFQRRTAIKGSKRGGIKEKNKHRKEGQSRRWSSSLGKGRKEIQESLHRPSHLAGGSYGWSRWVQEWGLWEEAQPHDRKRTTVTVKGREGIALTQRKQAVAKESTDPLSFAKT